MNLKNILIINTILIKVYTVNMITKDTLIANIILATNMIVPQNILTTIQIWNTVAAKTNCRPTAKLIWSTSRITRKSSNLSWIWFIRGLGEAVMEILRMRSIKGIRGYLVSLSWYIIIILFIFLFFYFYFFYFYFFYFLFFKKFLFFIFLLIIDISKGKVFQEEMPIICATISTASPKNRND